MEVNSSSPSPQPVEDTNPSPAVTADPPATSVAPTVDPANPAAPTLGADGQPIPPAFQPNLKYKVMDQEKVIPDFLKDVIKDAETEKKVKELFEKADGLDIVKPKYQETRQVLKQVQEENRNWQTSAQELRECYRRGDFDSFFQRLNIPEEKVLNWMVEKIRYNQLPPEQRQVFDERRSAQQQAWDREKSLSAAEQTHLQQLSSAKGELLELSLERAETKSFATAFDSKFGKPGAFRDAVISIGEAAWERGTDLSPQQAIKQAMDHYGKLISVEGAADPATPGVTQQPPASPGKSKEPPVIPNVSGRQTSPTSGGKPKSIDDLKKLAAAMT